MSGKLNHRSPLLRLKDSIKKNIKKEVDNAKPLTCYDETIEKKSFGRIKDIDELTYETRIGIAKWFQKNKIYDEVITKLLWINPQHIKTMHVPEIDPIKKKYLTIDDIHDLGIEYEPPVSDIKKQKPSVIKTDVKKKETKKIKSKRAQKRSIHITIENGHVSKKRIVSPVELAKKEIRLTKKRKKIADKVKETKNAR